jgi:hypothetical protein
MAAAIELSQARTALANAAARSAGLVASIPDLSVPAAHSQWTVAEAAAHLAIGLRGFTDAIVGHTGSWHDLIPDAAGFPERLSGLNQATISAEPPRAPGDAARAITDAADTYLRATASCSPSDRVATPWYGPGTSHSILSATCLLVGEQLLHGYDMARGIGRQWTITVEEAQVIFDAVRAMMPLLLNPDTSKDLVATYKLHVGRGSAFVVRVADGQATVNPPGRPRVDCHVAGTPVALLLVGYGRISQWRAIGTGRLIAWGRKPWLGFRFVHLFFNP